MGGAGSGRRRRPARRARLAATAGLATGLAVVLAAGCGAPRVDAPSARRAGATPEVVVAPDDPADDPQLAALDLREDRPATREGLTGAADIPLLELLPRLAGGLRAELGDGAEVCVVEAAFNGVSADVPAGDHGDRWLLRLDEGRVRRVPLQSAPDCAATFRLDGVDFTSPARLAAGIVRRLPGARLTQVRLARSEVWGLTWSLAVTRGGQNGTVVADPSGSAVAVTP